MASPLAPPPCEETPMTDKLIIFDTTLRDGEQSPGASMTREEKLRIARQLERMKVDVMEAGFAASSKGDFLPRVCEGVIAEVATPINTPDTVGYAIPELYGNFIRELRAKVPNSRMKL